jgi:hypothetical protein
MGVTPPEPPPSNGKYLGWLNAVKGLTISNALVIILLAMVAVPTYVLWRAINDEKLLDRFLSHYAEYPSQTTSCTVRQIKVRGGPETFALSTGFASQGTDRYFISVVSNHMFNPSEERSYCETLNLLVDFMRDPEARSPPFPGSHEPIVRQYERGQKGDR